MTTGMLDPLDLALLSQLRTDARASTAVLARRLGVARTTVVSRLARLERQGVVLGYTVRLAPDTEHPAVMAHVGITVEPRRGQEVVLTLQALPELRQLYSVSGGFDYIAVLSAESTARLDRLLDAIGSIAGVTRTHTSVVLAVRVDRTTG